MMQSFRDTLKQGREGWGGLVTSEKWMNEASLNGEARSELPFASTDTWTHAYSAQACLGTWTANAGVPICLQLLRDCAQSKTVAKIYTRSRWGGHIKQRLRGKIMRPTLASAVPFLWLIYGDSEGREFDGGRPGDRFPGPIRVLLKSDVAGSRPSGASRVQSSPKRDVCGTSVWTRPIPGLKAGPVVR